MIWREAEAGGARQGAYPVGEYHRRDHGDRPAYPSLQLAQVIIHEATHEFAATEDYALTEKDS